MCRKNKKMANSSTKNSEQLCAISAIFCDNKLRAHLRSFAVSTLLFMLLPVPHAGAVSWEKAYKNGDYTNALQALKEAPTNFPDIGNYNRGNVLYRMNDFQGSEKAYSSATAQTTDENLKQKALYNRGTALLAGTLAQTNAVADTAEQAAKLFEESLFLQPKDISAKQNVERAINWIVTTRLKDASKLIQDADTLLTQFKAKTAKENYIKAKKLLVPIFADFAPENAEAKELVLRADEQLKLLEQAVKEAQKELETAKIAIAKYEYKTAADIMRDDKPTRKWAFDLDEKLAKDFEQFKENNRKVLEIVFPPNLLKP